MKCRKMKKRLEVVTTQQLAKASNKSGQPPHRVRIIKRFHHQDQFLEGEEAKREKDQLREQGIAHKFPPS